MSLGGGSSGSSDNSAQWAMVSELQQQRQRADTEALRIKAQNDAKEAETEVKRVERLRSGGLSAFATNGFTGYSDRTLGGGASVSMTV